MQNSKHDKRQRALGCIVLTPDDLAKLPVGPHASKAEIANAEAKVRRAIFRNERRQPGYGTRVTSTT
jgi:hypothetical protein